MPQVNVPVRLPPGSRVNAPAGITSGVSWRSLRNLLARLARVDVPVVDYRPMTLLTETERRDLWEICDERYQTRSTIMTS